jgi:phosphatidylethanolamine-binding protein (PEBP) family uncharacterized protein
MLTNKTKNMLTNKTNNTTNTNTTKTKKRNSQIEYLQVYYPDTLLQTINNNQDISNIPNVSSIYQNQPKVTIKNAQSKLYLITMTDPDAPYGVKINKSNLNNPAKKNHTYTHWVYLQDMRNTKTNSTNTTNKTNTTNSLVNYAPPSPPYGIHRYQFKIYNVTTVSQTILDTLKQSNTNLDRNNYNKNNLKNLIKYKIKSLFQYKVNSGK